MPRQFLVNRCEECRRRRVKCSGGRPRCFPCQRGSRKCQWPQGARTTSSRKAANSASSVIARSAPLTPSSQNGSPKGDEFTSTDNPEVALQDARVYRLLRYYTTHLAAWYDLNDRQRHFTDTVPVRARHSPLLLSAILAFSAASKHGSDGKENLMDLAEFYHLQSVQILIKVTDNIQDLDTAASGEVLTAICLLRSYEIITQKLCSQSHLQGCYSLLAANPIKPQSGLLHAAFWNYLREDITVALIERRRLMIELHPEHIPQRLDYDDDYANYVTVLLGQIINHSFDRTAGPLDLPQWTSLHESLESWRSCLPTSFEPVVPTMPPENKSLPFVWTLHGWHAAALQYYHTAMIILLLAKPTQQPLTAMHNMGQIVSLTRELDGHASKVCALALTSDSAPVWVNAFGPIAFCGPWVRDQNKVAQIAKEVQLWGSKTGWPVSNIVYTLTDRISTDDTEPAAANPW